jgi:hypothetical protein
MYVGLARTTYIFIRCVYGISGREITKYTVIYGTYIRFWPTLINIREKRNATLCCVLDSLFLHSAHLGCKPALHMHQKHTRMGSCTFQCKWIAR